MKQYHAPKLDEKRLRGACEKLLATKGDKFTLPGIGFTLFERLWSLCGMENALIFMLTEPEFVENLLDEIVAFECGIIDVINEYAFDGFYFGDDWGQQKGLIMGKPLWTKFLKPRLKTLYARAKKGGKRIFQHSCGDCSEVLGDLIEIGLDCYQTFQPEIYDVAKIKQEYGNDLSFWGGVSTQRLLPYATPKAVKDETRRLIAMLGRGGGYIAAPTHAIPCDVPPENVLAMLDVFMNQ